MTSTDFNFIAPTTRGDYKSWLRDPSLFSSHGFGYTASQSISEEISVTDPTTLETIGTVPFCNRDDITNAIAGVERAGKNWKRVPARERADCLFKLYQLMLSNKSDLAHVVSFEQGRPLVESVNEVEYAASYVRWYAEECERVYSYGIPSLNSSYQQLVYREPVGPVLAITPWNAPCSMITRKLAPAIAAGCPVILKPSELTPFSALAIYELCVRAGFPDGLLQVLTGEPSEISDILLNSSSIRKISFTGSTAVGRALAAKAAHNLKRISLELGGNAPFIVRADACMDTAVSAALVAKFRVGGQSCIAANRFLVHRTRVHEFADALI